MGRAIRAEKGLFLAAVLFATFIGWVAGEARGDEAPAGADTPSLASHFAYDLRVLSFGVLQQPINSTQNPSNNFLQLQRYVMDTEIRPDLRLTFDSLDLLRQTEGQNRLQRMGRWEPERAVSGG